MDRSVYVVYTPGVRKGPDKKFDPEEALEKAVHLFWSNGYAGTGMAELQAQMGIGRKSLYDTFGNKRELFIKALGLYAETVPSQLVDELNKDGSPLQNVRDTMRMLQEWHSLPDSTGCLYGSSMAQFGTNDPEMAEILRHHVKSLEQAFYDAFKRAQDVGELDAKLNIRDLARMYEGIHQGLALIGQVHATPEVTRSIVNASLATLDRLEVR